MRQGRLTTGQLVALAENLLSASHCGWQYHEHHDKRRERENDGANRAGKKDCGITIGDDHSPPEVLFEHRPEYKAEEEPSWLAPDAQKDVSEHSEAGHGVKIE